MSECTFTIEKHIAVIGRSGGNGKITKELNIVKCGNNPAKYDLRAWSANHEKGYKGIVLNVEELKTLREVLNGLKIEESEADQDATQ